MIFRAGNVGGWSGANSPNNQQWKDAPDTAAVSWPVVDGRTLTRLVDQTLDPPTVVDYYVNTSNTAGGDGTTPATSGANRAFATLATAISTVRGLGAVWNTLNKRPVIHCVGTVAETTAVTLGTWTDLSDRCYLMIVGDAPSALQYSTANYRIETTGGGGLFNDGCPYLWTQHLQVFLTISVATGGRVAVNVTGAPSGWTIHESMHVKGSIIAGQLSGVNAMQQTNSAGQTHKLIAVNCVVRDFIAAGASHAGIVAQTAPSMVYAFNCTGYNCANAFISTSTNFLAKNCGAFNCDDCWQGTFLSDSTNNASDQAADAPGTNPRNSVTPTMVAAGTDFHLDAADTAWKEQGADLSADHDYAFTTDGDGETRS